MRYKSCIYFTLFSILLSALSSKAQEPKLVLPIAHHSGINDFKFSPNEKLIATGSSDKTIKIWNVKTGTLLYNFTDHTKSISEIDFNKDGKLLATTGDASVRIWNIETGKLLFELKGEILSFNTVEFSPDGKNVLAGVNDGSFLIWDLSTKKQLLKVETSISYDIGSQYFARYTTDGRKVFTNTQDSTIAIFNAFNGKKLSELPKFKGQKVINAIVSADSKHLFRWGSKKFYGDVFELDTYKEQYKIESTGNYPASRGNFTNDNQFYIAPSNLNSTIDILAINTGKVHHSIKGNFQHYDSFQNLILVSLDGELWVKDLNTGQQKIKINLKGKFDDYGKSVLSKNGSYIALLKTNYETQNYGVEIYSVNTGQFISELTGHTIDFDGIALSPNAKSLLINSRSNNQKVWNTENLEFDEIINNPLENFKYINYSPKGNYIFSFNLEKYPENTLYITNSSDLSGLYSFGNVKAVCAFTSDDKYLATAGTNDEIKFWNLITGDLVSEFAGGKYFSNRIDHFEFNKENDRLLVTYNDSTFRLMDPFKGEIIHRFKESKAEGLSTHFTPDSKFIVSSNAYGYELKIWDVKSGKLINKIKDKEDFMAGVNFNLDGSKMASYTHHHDIAKVWDFNNKKLLTTLFGHKSQVWKIDFFPSENKILTTANDDDYRIWDTNGKLLKTANLGSHTLISNISFPTNKIVATSHPEIKFFNLKTGVKQYSLLCIDSTDYIAITPSGYYKSSPSAAKNIHYLTKDQKIITFEQLDVKYNRPDKVLEAIGSTDTSLVKSYKRAYQKRIKKLGIDTTSFKTGYSVPEADFSNRNLIEREQKKQQLTLKIKGADDTYNLDRFNVWVNENPIFGLRGFSLKKNLSKSIDTTITVELSEGENQIETSITNVNGIESYRMPLKINYKSDSLIKEKLFFVGIGIDQFEQNQYNLQWSVKDIRDQVNALKLKYGESLIIDTLFNDQVKTSNIKGIKQKLKTSTVNDKVIIAYSGHGLLSAEFDYFLSTYDTNFEKPEQSGLPYEELEDLLDNIPARKKMMLIDACHSGEVDKEELLKYKNAETTLAANKTKGAKGAKVVNTGVKKAGMKTSMELMQQLFLNVSRSTGATIISAAAGTQFALEKNDLKNGVFSYSILEYMKANSSATVSDLKKYVNKRVVELTAGLQVPTTRNETNNNDWKVW